MFDLLDHSNSSNNDSFGGNNSIANMQNGDMDFTLTSQQNGVNNPKKWT